MYDYLLSKLCPSHQKLIVLFVATITKRYANVDYHTVEKVCMNWFRHASDRLQRSQRQNVDRTQQEDSDKPKSGEKSKNFDNDRNEQSKK